MSDVSIYKDASNQWHCEVDGVDLASAIKDGSLRVEFPQGTNQALVYVTFIPRKLRMRLPGSVVSAVEDLLPGGGA